MLPDPVASATNRVVPLLDGRASSAQIAASAAPFTLLPVGSCEQHGPHLPVITDAMVATRVATAICEQLGGLLLPTLAYGTSSEHRGMPGTVSLRPATLAAVLTDVAESCAQWGANRLVVLSGHGGNWILRPAVRQVNATHPECSVGLVPERVLWAEGLEEDLHAGAAETSLLLYLDPAAVGQAPPDEIPDVPREALDLLSLAELTSNGVWGRPSLSDPQEGERLLAAMVERTAAYVSGTLMELFARRENARKRSHT
ncbi:MAG: creatininase family protein [Acidimicrobiales bacterium]